MSSSLPEGAVARAATRADAASAADIVRMSQEALIGRSRMAVPDRARVDLEHNSWLFEERDRLIAFGWLDPHGGVAGAGGFVHPGETGRGLGTALVERSEERARELSLPRIRQWAIAADLRTHALFEARGYKEVRRFWEMAIELREPPSGPHIPQGLRIETFREEDARAFHAASTEAFAEEWGFVGLPFVEWWEYRSHAEDFDPTLWFLVRSGDEVAAVCRYDANRRGGGFVGMLGVRKSWRKRGLGLALLRHAFGEFYRRGDRRVGLGVDSENPTGATRLYERAGMHVESEFVVRERELA
jgi:mycothiol synthase